MEPGKIQKHLHFLLNELPARGKHPVSWWAKEATDNYGTDAIPKCDVSSSKMFYNLSVLMVVNLSKL